MDEGSIPEGPFVTVLAFVTKREDLSDGSMRLTIRDVFPLGVRILGEMYMRLVPGSAPRTHSWRIRAVAPNGSKGPWTPSAPIDMTDGAPVEGAIPVDMEPLVTGLAHIEVELDGALISRVALLVESEDPPGPYGRHAGH
jgi:hypothetical protein